MAHTLNDSTPNGGSENYMQAPRPFYEVYTRRGSLYKADEYGIIDNVHGSDLQDLRNAGCRDHFPTEVFPNQDPLSSTKTEDQTDLVHLLPEPTRSRVQNQRKAKAASPEGEAEVIQAAEAKAEKPASNGLVPPPPSTDDKQGATV